MIESTTSVTERPIQNLPAGIDAFTAAAEAIRRELALRRTSGEAAIRGRLARAQADGELPPNLKPGDLARYVVTVVHGMAVQAASGASRDDLLRVVRMALRAWPG